MAIAKFNNWIKSSIRLVFTALICGLLLVTNMYSAQAATSSPQEGEANLNRIQDKTERVSNSNPRSLEETSKEAEKGLNAVQGGADKDKMISREDASGETTVEEQAKNFLQGLTN